MVELEVLGVSMDGQHVPLVLLRHEERVLPIMIGPAEAESIHLALMNESVGRPLSHDLICNLLAGLRGELQSVVIYKLENDTFYAHLNIEQKSPEGEVEQVLRVDSRPSDGIGIACRLKAPIFAAEEVMDLASQEMAVQEEEEDDEPDTADDDS